MPALLFLVIVFLLLPVSSGVALAERITDFSQIKGVFLYENFQQWLNLSYNYSGSETGTSSSTSHAFKESYNASLKMALFDTSIFDANLQGGVIFDQNRSRGDDISSSTKNSSYQYNFSGNGLSKSRVPFTILSLRNTNTVLNTYMSPTTTDTNTNEFGISFLNNKLQSYFTYSRNSIDNTVNGMTSNSLSNSYSYSASHQYGGMSTSVSAAFSDQTGGTSNGDMLTTSTNSLGLTNTLNFGEQQAYSLLSSFQLENTTVDNLPQRYISFTESFGAVLGRALTFNAVYSLTNNQNSGLTGDETINKGEIRIRHKLFDSLVTELFSDVTLNKRNGGTENRYSVTGNAGYVKNLPTGDQLSLGVNKGYALVDRDVVSSTVTVTDQLHRAVHQGDVIVLDLNDGTLLSLSAVTSRNPIYTYVEGVDYTVNYTLGRITILSGGGVSIDMDGSGTDLYISYTVYQNPRIKYATDSVALTSNLALFNNQINIGSTWSQAKQKVISGPTLNTLQGSRALSLYVNGTYNTFNGGLTYRNELMDRLSYQVFEGNGSVNWNTSNATVSLTAHDIYTMYGATSTSAAYSENSSNATVSYGRTIMSNASLVLQANASDIRSDVRPAKDTLGLQGRFQIELNKFSINLTGQTVWVFYSNSSSSTSRSDSVYVNLARYF
ncbi:MAG: hypothetical protein ACOYL3_01530 [Desulfuromonadaceae bacterium]